MCTAVNETEKSDAIIQHRSWQSPIWKTQQTLYGSKTDNPFKQYYTRINGKIILVGIPRPEFRTKMDEISTWQTWQDSLQYSSI